MSQAESRGNVINTLADVAIARIAAKQLRDQILESLTRYHKDLTHNLPKDFPTAYSEVNVENRSQFPLILSRVPLIIVYHPEIIQTEGFSRFEAKQEGIQTPFIAMYRNRINQIEYLHPIETFDSFVTFRYGWHITNTRAVDETTEAIHVLGVLVYPVAKTDHWSRTHTDSAVFPVVIPADHIIGIAPGSWLWTEQSLTKRASELG